MLWHFSDELLSSITVLLTCFYHVDRQAFNKTIVRADPNFVVKDYFFFFLSDNDFFFFKLFYHVHQLPLLLLFLFISKNRDK